MDVDMDGGGAFTREEGSRATRPRPRDTRRDAKCQSCNAFVLTVACIFQCVQMAANYGQLVYIFLAAAAFAAHASIARSEPISMSTLPPWGVAVSNLSSCTIPVVPALTVEDFRKHFKGRRPIIFSRPLSLTAGMRARTSRDVLRAERGGEAVLLASSNSFSHDKLPSTLGEYMDNHMGRVEPWKLSNETWYAFGDHSHDGWEAELLSAEYPFPVDSEEDNGLRVMGLGGQFSGVAFHTHGAAHAEVIHGRKRWYLTPPGKRPVFDGDKSQLSWVLSRMGGGGGGSEGGGGNRKVWEAVLPSDPDYASMDAEGYPRSFIDASLLTGGDDGEGGGGGGGGGGTGLLVCTAGPGQVLYIPPQWWHATLNMDEYNVFVSVFTQEPPVDRGAGGEAA